METNYLSQTLLALWAVLIGAFLCVIYDIMRVFRLRKGGKTKGIWLFFWDLMFCMLATVCMLVLFFNLTYGKVRVYAFVFSAIGFLLWRVTLGRLITALLLKVFQFIESLLTLAKKRVIAITLRLKRIIYTKNYCRRLIKQSGNGFGMLKRKDNENERVAKETVES